MSFKRWAARHSRCTNAAEKRLLCEIDSQFRGRRSEVTSSIIDGGALSVQLDKSLNMTPGWKLNLQPMERMTFPLGWFGHGLLAPTVFLHSERQTSRFINKEPPGKARFSQGQNAHGRAHASLKSVYQAARDDFCQEEASLISQVQLSSLHRVLDLQQLFSTPLI